MTSDSAEPLFTRIWRDARRYVDPWSFALWVVVMVILIVLALL